MSALLLQSLISLCLVATIIAAHDVLPIDFQLDSDDAPNDFIGISKAPLNSEQRSVIESNYKLWLRNNLEAFRPGDYVNRKFDIAYTPERGYALFARQPIRPGDTVVRLPLMMMLQRWTVCPPSSWNPLCFRLITRMDEQQATTKLVTGFLRDIFYQSLPLPLNALEELPIAIVVAIVKFCKSCKRDPMFAPFFHWEPYVAHFPADVTVPACSFTPSQLRDEGLPTGVVNMIRAQRRAMRSQFEFVRALLADSAQHLAPGEDELHEEEWLTLPQLMWATCNVMSRIFNDALIPVFDTLNHDSRFYNFTAAVTGSAAQSHRDMKFVTGTGFEIGEEITWSYFSPRHAGQNEGVFFIFGMVDAAMPCVYVTLSSTDEQFHPFVGRQNSSARHAIFMRQFKPNRPRRTDGSEDLIGCFRFDVNVKNNAVVRDNMNRFKQLLELQREQTAACLEKSKSLLIVDFCKQQAAEQVKLIGQLETLEHGTRGDL